MIAELHRVAGSAYIAEEDGFSTTLAVEEETPRDAGLSDSRRTENRDQSLTGVEQVGEPGQFAAAADKTRSLWPPSHATLLAWEIH